MNIIKEPRDYIWTLPLIGGILVLISFFTPAFYAEQMGVKVYSWMWGLLYGSMTSSGSDTVFIATEKPSQYMLPIFISGLIPAILILISSIMIIFSANLVRTGRRDIKYAENGWIGMGVMLLVASIIYIIGIDITWMDFIEYEYELIYGYVPPLMNFWDAFDPGFAIIAPFIGAILSIGGSIASKAIKPREVPIYMKQKQGGMISKTPIGQITHKIKFCSECGHQVLYDGAKFCSNCGKAIKF